MRKLNYPDDLEFIVQDIMKYVKDSLSEAEVRKAIIPLLEQGIVEPTWDSDYGKEVGLSGRVFLKWNQDWEILDFINEGYSDE